MRTIRMILIYTIAPCVTRTRGLHITSVMLYH